MSTNNDDAAEPVAQAINGFAELSMEHTGGCQYSVLSWRNDGLTTHRVNTADLTCTCEDQAFNKDGQQVCDHVAYAVYHAPKEREVSAEAFTNLINNISSLNDRVNALQGEPTAVESTASDADDEAAADDADSGMTVTVGSAKALLKETLDEHDEFYLNGDLGSDTYEGTDQVTFGVGGDDFDRVKAVTSECDLVGYNGTENTLPIHDVEQYVEEVL